MARLDASPFLFTIFASPKLRQYRSLNCQFWYTKSHEKQRAMIEIFSEEIEPLLIFASDVKISSLS